MTPSAWRDGGRGETIRWTTFDSPLGETRSYAEIAAAIGAPKAVRAVGTANGDNHVCVLIPCHRVIRSDGSLGGYGGGLDRKKKLLAAEGSLVEAPELPLVE
jgi:AraC family transcriptional regulator of adaptative response/methylated-DNA-[protein]-cysteine methyltransferase